MGESRALFKAFVVFLAAVPIAIYGYEYGSDAGYTGAPGDNTTGCIAAGCHTGTANSGTGSVRIVASGGLFYRPGRSQQIQVIINDSIEKKYGFQLTARVSGNPHTTQAGLLSPVGDGSTQVLCGDGSQALPNGCSASIAHSLEWIENTPAGYNRSNSHQELIRTHLPGLHRRLTWVRSHSMQRPMRRPAC